MVFITAKKPNITDKNNYEPWISTLCSDRPRIQIPTSLTVHQHLYFRLIKEGCWGGPSPSLERRWTFSSNTLIIEGFTSLSGHCSDPPSLLSNYINAVLWPLVLLSLGRTRSKCKFRFHPQNYLKLLKCIPPGVQSVTSPLHQINVYCSSNNRAFFSFMIVYLQYHRYQQTQLLVFQPSRNLCLLMYNIFFLHQTETHLVSSKPLKPQVKCPKHSDQ